MNEFDLLINKELRDNTIERVEILEQVKEILTLGTTDFVTVEMASQYYDVSMRHIKRCISENRKELELYGLKTYSYYEIKELIKGDINNTVKIPISGITVMSKGALLRIGMLLRDSGVAKEIRTRLLDIVYDAETKTDIVNNVVNEII